MSEKSSSSSEAEQLLAASKFRVGDVVTHGGVLGEVVSIEVRELGLIGASDAQGVYLHVRFDISQSQWILESLVSLHTSVWQKQAGWSRKQSKKK